MLGWRAPRAVFALMSEATSEVGRRNGAGRSSAFGQARGCSVAHVITTSRHRQRGAGSLQHGTRPAEQKLKPLRHSGGAAGPPTRGPRTGAALLGSRCFRFRGLRCHSPSVLSWFGLRGVANDRTVDARGVPAAGIHRSAVGRVFRVRRWRRPAGPGRATRRARRWDRTPCTRRPSGCADCRGRGRCGS